MTSYLKECDGLLTLIEGPYRSNDTRGVLQSNRLLLIGGGIGITGLLSFVDCHRNVKLLYGVKAGDQCLLDAISAVLDDIQDKDIDIGCRLAVDALLREEAEIGWRKTGVVVCGPAGMCDDARAAVAKVARDMAGVCSFALEVDSFSW